MKSCEWIKLIKEEFNVSSTVAKNMYHVMIEYYKSDKRVKERVKNEISRS